MNFYEILGVADDATDKTIKDAYRRAAMEWHPDRHEGEQAKREATARFKAIHEAYRTLKDPAERARYDQELQAERQASKSQRASNSDEQASQRKTQSANAGNSGASDSTHAKGMSGEEAEQMFFEQMLDMALEMAARGFPEERVAVALEALGCPHMMAIAAAKAACTAGRRKHSANQEAESRAAVRNIQDTDWLTAEPLYRAFIAGDKNASSLTDSEFKVALGTETSRNQLTLRLLTASVTCSISAILMEGYSILYVSLMLIDILTFLASLVFRLGPYIGQKRELMRRYKDEKVVRYYLESFREYHLGGRNSIGARFNSSAFWGSFFWMAYRGLIARAIVYAAISAAIGLSITLVEVKFVGFDYRFLSGLAGICLFISIPIRANKYYFDHATKAINRRLANHRIDRLQPALRLDGGTKIFGAIIVGFVSLVFSIPNWALQRDYLRSVAIEAERNRVEQEEQRQRIVAARESAAKASAERESNFRYQALVKAFERKYPFLNPDSSAYDAKALEWVGKRFDAHLAAGAERENALKLAIADMESAIAASKVNRPITRQSGDNAHSSPSTTTDEPLRGQQGQSATEVLCNTFAGACQR